MSENIGTPGPWTVWSSLYEGFGAAVVRDAEPLKTVAEVRNFQDARLIAGAPDYALICWAMCVQDGRWEAWSDGRGEFCFAGLRHATTLDKFGCPVLTPHLRAALENARTDSAAAQAALSNPSPESKP